MTVLLSLLVVAACQDVKPRTYHISAKNLVDPYQTPSVNNGPRVTERDGAPLHVAPGYKVVEWAKDLDRPRNITVAPNGDVFVAESYRGQIALLRDADGDGTPEVKNLYKSGLKQPYGIEFYPKKNPKWIYIANTDAVFRYPYRSGELKNDSKGEKILDLPGGGYNQHWTRNLLFSSDDRHLYVTVGSASNASPEDPPRASIIEIDPTGGRQRMLATGIRNPVGIDLDPTTGKLWVAVNERDALGDEIVPDYATSVKDGGFYGWPYFYIGSHHDPRLPLRTDLRAKVIVPDVLLEAHCAALGIAFPSKGSNFSGAYVSMHGSWNRSRRSGYKVVKIDPKHDGGYSDFVWGWALEDGRVWGRPVDVAFDRSGSLLISDDGGGKIWRVTKS